MSYEDSIFDHPLKMISIGLTCFSAIVIIVLGVSMFQHVFDDKGNVQYEELSKKVGVILSNPKVSCSDIQDLRTQSINAKNWYEDPLYGGDSLDKAHDLWKVKQCGSDWGFFDK